MTPPIDDHDVIARVRALPELRVPVGRDAILVVAHLGEGVVGAGALAARLAAAGVALSVLAVTDAACPVGVAPEAGPGWEAGAWSRLGVGPAEVDRIGLPVGDVAGYAPVVGHRLAGRLTLDSICIAPWPQDADPDHEAVGRAAEAAARSVGAPLIQYPVGHRPDRDLLPWARCHRLDLDDREAAGKGAGVGTAAGDAFEVYVL